MERVVWLREVVEAGDLKGGLGPCMGSTWRDGGAGQRRFWPFVGPVGSLHGGEGSSWRIHV